ncbi:MAG: polyketide synthase [Elusimicrobia bacterium RIFOXYA2_FULL_40_6]|nr:MAG: polyketide synthase [Elusimicrobia bacterium RIFOXYA2_FULL_40_6]
MKTPGTAHIAGVSAVVPPFSLSQQEAENFVKRNYEGKLNRRSLSILSRTLKHPSIKKRHFSFENPEVLIDEDPDKRIKRFTESSIELSAKAIENVLAKTGLKPGDITGLVVNTCTGYICPGLSTYLIEKLGLNRSVRSYDLVGSGCGGAVPNLQICEALLKESSDNIVLSVSVEICSSTFQMTDDPSQLISDCLFGDGASACVLWNRPEGLALVLSESRFLPEYREDIRFVHKNGQLHNQLSARLPDLAGKAVSGLIKDILAKAGLEPADIKHWALHPGGENIINALIKETGLTEENVSCTRAILSKYGNMSSPTAIFVLNEILDKGVKREDFFLLASFGAGFSGHAYVLRA